MIRGKTCFHENRRPPRRGQHQERRLLDAAIFAGVDRRDLALHELGQPRRLSKILVQLEVVHDESQRSAGRRGRGLEPQGVVFHLRHAFLILGLRVRDEVRLDTIHAGLTTSRRHGVDVDAHEQITVGAAKERTARQLDQRIGRAREYDVQSTPHELGAQQFADAERDVFFRSAARERQAGITRIDTPVPWIHDNGMREPESGDRIGRRRRRRGDNGTGGRHGRCSGGRRRALIESCQPRIPPVAAGEQTRHVIGEPVQREKQRVARDVRRAHQRIRRAVAAEERRPDIKIEDVPTESHARGGPVERDGESQWLCEQNGRDGGIPCLTRHGHAGLPARGRDQDLLWNQRGQKQDDHHDRLPFTTRAISRSATRRFRSSRLSWAFFALASAMATLARPSLK